MTKRIFRKTAALAALGLVAFVGPSILARADEATGVTAMKLQDARSDAGSWLWYGRDLGANRYSPLSAIDPTTVSQLSLAWKKTLGPAVSMEATPIVADGVMYVSTGNSTIWAMDAVTGAKKWSYVYPLPIESLPEACCDTDNRGVTLTGNKVIFGTLDAHLVALDARTGKVLWNTAVARSGDGYAITSPPLPVKNLVLTGIAGGEYATRGFIAAYDSSTGKQVWRHYTVPAKGDPGYSSWNVRGVAERGGVPTWLPGTYDAKLDTVYWGTGNPNPDFDANSLSGSLLYSSSVLALDPATGKQKWYYQFTPHDIWDFDAVSEPILVDVPIDGKIVRALAHADRNGYLYLLDRVSGKLVYAVPFLDKINWGSVSRSGVLTLNAAMQKASLARKPFTVFPAVIGGKNWEPAAYDPEKHLLFIPALETSIQLLPSATSDAHPKKGALNFGAGFAKPVLAGSVVAIDLTTGKQAWKRPFKSAMTDGALVTAGGLVFIGTPEGRLLAMDEATGKTVWSAKTASGINASPITYEIGGKQYVSVVSGSGGVVVKYFIGAAPQLHNVPKCSLVYTWVLNGKSVSVAPAEKSPK